MLSGRLQVRKLPVSAFKRNGMQDQEHSKLLGTPNFLTRCPDVMLESPICLSPIKVADPVNVPLCSVTPAFGRAIVKKTPIEVSIEDIEDTD